MIEHVALWVSDIEAAKTFYTRYFSCTSGPLYQNTSNGFRSYFLSFKMGARIEIMQMPGIRDKCSENAQHMGWVHIAISLGSVDAVDRLFQELSISGERLVDQPRWTGDGYYEFTVLDVEGNRIEVTT